MPGGALISARLYAILGSMISAKDVYEAQNNLRRSKEDLYHLRESIAWDLRRANRNSLMGGDEWTRSESHPDVIKLKQAIEEREVKLAAQQAEVGGKVYRVPAENLTTFESKIAKLNKKAAKLGCEPTTFKIVETDEEERSITGPSGLNEKVVYVWNYIALNAVKPMVPGYRFIAALDHTVQQQEGDPVIVKQVPSIEEELDLSAWRYADPRCDHCKKVRSRNTTYLVEEIETKKIAKVGSSCLRDFTGANDPERVASYLEYIADFDESSDEEGESYGGIVPKRMVHQYLTHVAACIRRDGWTSRSQAEFGAATADQAWNNIHYYGKRDKAGNLMYIELTDDDSVTAEKAVEWARNLEAVSDFDHNLKTMAGLTAMPDKGDGIVAYIVQGFVKDETKRIEREAEQKRREEALATAEPITEGRQVITGTIVKMYEKNSDWGVVHKMTVLDDRGFQVNGTVPKEIDIVGGKVRYEDGREEILKGHALHYRDSGELVESLDAKVGDRVSFTARIKPKDGDPLFGWYTRPTKATIIETEEVA